MSRIEKEKNYNSTTTKPDNQVGKWAKDLNRLFCKGDTQVADKHMKRCSTSLSKLLGSELLLVTLGVANCSADNRGNIALGGTFDSSKGFFNHR